MAVLLVVFAMRLAKTKKFMPAGMMLVVTVAALAGMILAMESPDLGVVEPDELDYRRALEICRPYLGPVVGAYTDWTPLHQRGTLFPEDLDTGDPWQFKNILVG